MTKSNVRAGGFVAAAWVVLLMIVGAPGVSADEFEQTLAYVDKSLKANPNYVPPHALYACQDRRNRAGRLYRRGQEARALRSLKYCFNLLGVSAVDIKPEADLSLKKTETIAQTRKRAAKEGTDVLALKGNVASGLEIYRGCASCHTPEGWGMSSGVVPQLAGQHRSVVIKQLADIRAGYRKNRVMAPYSSIEAIGGPQAVADVAAYIDTLEISIENGKGPGKDLALGAQLYEENCVRCHGAKGEGNNETQVPRIQAQHFGYLVTQFELIRDGGRRNANPEMVEQIKGFDERKVKAVMDYVSRLEPPSDLQAPPDWRNPDFAQVGSGM